MVMNWVMVSSSGTRNLVLSRRGRYFSFWYLSTITCFNQSRLEAIKASRPALPNFKGRGAGSLPQAPSTATKAEPYRDFRRELGPDAGYFFQPGGCAGERTSVTRARSPPPLLRSAAPPPLPKLFLSLKGRAACAPGAACIPPPLLLLLLLALPPPPQASYEAAGAGPAPTPAGLPGAPPRGAASAPRPAAGSLPAGLAVPRRPGGL